MNNQKKKSNSKKPNILFFGELPPNVVHGVSISNKINTDILKELGELTIVEEKWNLRYHEQFALRKIVSSLKSVLEIFYLSFRKTPELFYSVLNVSAFGSMKNFVNLVAMKLGSPKAKVLFHVHRSDLIELLKKKILFRILIRYFNWCGVHFIVLSENQKMEVGQYLGRVKVLYNAIDEEEIYPIQRSDQKSDSAIQILYISNYIRQKGILDLLEAFLGLEFKENRLQLNCYGGFTDEKTKKEIEQLTKEVDHIMINTAVYGEEKNRALNEADIVVLPSYNEGLPLVLLEALRLSKPIVITNVGYISEVLGSDYPLFCKPGDIQSIQEAIRKAAHLIHKESFKKKIRQRYKPISSKMHKLRLENIILSMNL